MKDGGGDGQLPRPARNPRTDDPAPSAAAVHTARRDDAPTVGDMAALVRLEGELGELATGPEPEEAQRRHALDGMARLVGATAAVWARLDGLRSPGHPLLGGAVVWGFEGEHERHTFFGYVEDAQVRMPDPMLPVVRHRLTPPVCSFLRHELVDDRGWYRSPHVAELRRSGRVDSCIYTIRLDDDGGGGAAIALHRPWGARPFGERERALVDVFYRESRRLRVLARRSREGGQSPSEIALPPRLVQTLAALARGLSEKQVAAELGLSQHTVHDYVKELHRRLRVQSRGELLARYLGGER
jgi:hypothetical protein